MTLKNERLCIRYHLYCPPKFEMVERISMELSIVVKHYIEMPCKFEVYCLKIKVVMTLGNYIVYTVCMFFVRPEPLNTNDLLGFD